MLKAISKWVKHLLHLHNWLDEDKQLIVNGERGYVPCGTRYTQKCSICSKRRKQDIY